MNTPPFDEHDIQHYGEIAYPGLPLGDTHARRRIIAILKAITQDERLLPRGTQTRKQYGYIRNGHTVISHSRSNAIHHQRTYGWPAVQRDITTWPDGETTLIHRWKPLDDEA